MKKTRIVSMALAAALLAGTMAGCGAGKTADDGSIKIGMLAPLTGKVSSYGQASSNGSILAIEQANTNKMFDKDVTFKLFDERGENAEAVNAYNRLVSQEKITALVGDITSGPTTDVAKAAVKDNMPMITPTGTAAPITKQGSNVFRACYLDEAQGRAMAEFAAKTLKLTKVAIVYNTSDDYYVGLMEAFKSEAEKNGIEIVASESYGANDTDFRAQLTTIAAKNPQAIYMPDYYNVVYTICSQKKEISSIANIPALGADGWDGVLTLENADATVVNGAYFTNHYAADDPSEKVQNFLKDYKARFTSEPASFAALGFDAANIMMEAIKKAGSTDRAKIVEALKGIEFEGVTGKITFDENGDPIKSISVIEIKDGKYTLHSKVEK